PIAIVAGSGRLVAAKSLRAWRSARMKSADAGPARRPITAKGRNSRMDSSRNGATWYTGSSPRKNRTTTVEVTAETTAGPKSRIEKDPTTTSSTNNVAAIGVL